MTESLTPANPCPHCGRSRISLEARCESCGWRPEPTRTPAFLRVKTAVTTVSQAALTISISSLMLVTTIFAVCVAILATNPIYGSVVSFICCGALWRTALYVGYSKLYGETVPVGDKILAFLSSFLFVGLVAFSTLILFVAVCVSTTLLSRNVWMGGFAGVLVALLAAIAILTLIPAYRKNP